MIDAIILTAVVILVPAIGFAALVLQDEQDRKERARQHAEHDPIRQAEVESERIRQYIEERQREIRKIVQRMQEDAMREHLHNIARQHYEQGEVIDTDGSVVHRRALPARTRYDA